MRRERRVRGWAGMPPLARMPSVLHAASHAKHKLTKAAVFSPGALAVHRFAASGSADITLSTYAALTTTLRSLLQQKLQILSPDGLPLHSYADPRKPLKIRCYGRCSVRYCPRHLSQNNSSETPKHRRRVETPRDRGTARQPPDALRPTTEAPQHRPAPLAQRHAAATA